MLREEIRNCMSALNVNGAHFDAKFVFPADFTGFRGHFPQKPILPGVCTVQAVLVAFQAWKQCPVKLQEITNAKFFATVSPDEELQFSCETVAKSAEPMLVKALISNNGKKIAQIKLKVTCPAPGEARG